MEKYRAGNRLHRIRKVLRENFVDVEQLGMGRFILWGPAAAKHRPYVEVSFGEDFLNQEGSEFDLYIGEIVVESKGMLDTPHKGSGKQGEIVAAGTTGIEIHRKGHVFHLKAIGSDGSLSESSQ
jgi:hypothetical protein